VLFAAVHVFWAVGGRLRLAESAGRQLAEQRPGWFVAVGLWGVAGLLVLGAMMAVALTRPPARLRRHRRVILSATLLALLALGKRTIPTLVQDLLTETGVLAPAATTDWSVIRSTPTATRPRAGAAGSQAQKPAQQVRERQYRG
jgi:hypothetical protein